MIANIADIADIQLGYQFRTKIEPVANGTNSVIQIRDFDEERTLHNEGLLRVNLDKAAAQYLVKKGDVLFLSRGHRNWAVSIVDDLQDTVAVSHFFVLKIKTGSVLPGYVAWYINQEPVQEYLHTSARRGTHMPLIPLSAFSELMVEIPDIATQKKIVDLNRLMETEKRLLKELQTKRSLLINAISMNAVKNEKEK